MAKKFGKHMRFYVRCLGKGKMPDDGLCFLTDKHNLKIGCFISDDIFDLFIPTNEDYEELRNENLPRVFWGAGVPHGEFFNGQFTPLRQTIVLFMAAIAGEL